MSLTVKKIKTLDGKLFWYVRNDGVKPIDVVLYERLEDVPKQIRDYCDESKEATVVGVGQADRMGIRGRIYPNFNLKCGKQGFEGSDCIAELCVLAPWRYDKCPYLMKQE